MAERRRAEKGQLMAALMAALAIMMIFSSIAFQSWEDVLRREREAEMIFRAQEIARGISRYIEDRKTLPSSLNDLLKPGPRGQYYLRMAYRDPLVADGIWGLLIEGAEGTVYDPGDQVDASLNFSSDDILEKPRRRQTPPPGALHQGSPIGRIAGVRTFCTEKPFRVYKGFTEYSQWQFTYHDYQQAATAGGRPGAGRGRPNNPGGRPARNDGSLGADKSDRERARR